MNAIKRKYKDVLSDTTGTNKGPPIIVNITKDVTSVIKPKGRILLHYIDGSPKD